MLIDGFKSFADRTEIIFEPGITAIVGPNGSGKSNIVDAIKWLMGERSVKNLRGGVSDDLIFAGSKERKRSNIAIVSMVIEDGEGIEVPGKGLYRSVEVKRVFTRGERSVFYINNVRAFEREVEQFFSSSVRLSRRYAIIEQSAVEDLATMTSRDLARVIGDAADIGVFLANKVNAQAELAEAESELEKIEPVLEEWKERARSLAREVELKKRYQELSIELRRLKVGVLLEEYRAVKGNLEREEKFVNELRGEKDNLKLLYETLLEENEELEMKFREVIREYEEVEEQLKDVNNALVQRTTGEKLVESKLDTIEKELRTTSEAIERIASSIEKKIRDGNRISSEIDDLGKFIENREKELAAKRKILENLKNEIDAIDTAKERMLESIYEVKREIARLEDTLYGMKEREGQLRKEKKRKEDKLSSLKSEREEFKNRIEKLKQDIEEAEAERENLEEELGVLKKEIESVRKILAEREKEYSEKEITLRKIELEIERIKSEVDNYQDLGESTAEFIKFARDKGFEVIPVADLFPGEEERDITSFFDVSDAVVVRNISPSLLVDWMNRDGGRVKIIQNENDFLRSERNFKHFQTVEEFLESDEDGYTSTGFLRKDGIIFLGVNIESSVRPFNLRRRIKELEVELNRVKKEHTVLKGEVEDLRERLEKKIKSYEKTKEMLDTQIQSLTEMRSALERYEGKLNDVSAELEAVEFEMGEIEEEIEKIGRKKLEIEGKLGKEKEKLVAHRSDLEVLNAEFEKKEKEFKKLSEEYNEERIAIERKKVELKNLKEKYNETMRTLDRDKRRKEELVKEVEKLENQRRELEKKKEETTLEIRKLIKKRDGITAEVENLREKRNSIEDELKKKKSKLNRVQKKLSAVEKELEEKRSRLEELNISLNSVLTRIQDESGKLIGEVIDAPEYQLEIEKNLALKRIEEIEREIESLGPINNKAPDEYEKLMKEISELEEKRRDVVAAIEKHQMTIQEVESQARKKFFDVMKELEKNFNDLYWYLTGGSANFIASEASSLENIGVDIKLFLPDKNIRSIFSLSGGEKALMSIALILSIFKYKKAPFCILDEVDAPLDAANTERFGILLRELSKQTQFIVVTHNHKTMEMADRLYGVSMEDGASKVVSVSLKS